MKYLQIIIITLITIIIIAGLVTGASVFYISQKHPGAIQSYLVEKFLGRGSDEFIKNDEVSTVSSSTNNKMRVDTLSSDQQQFLEKSGIDAESLPSSISPEIEACFKDILGEDKIKDVENGKILSPLDILRAAVCLKKEQAY